VADASVSTSVHSACHAAHAAMPQDNLCFGMFRFTGFKIPADSKD
jgi:hypothetical protein